MAVSIMLPSVVGWCAIRAVWPEGSRLLRFGLGIAAGNALAGTVYFFALVLSDSAQASFIASESILFAVAVVSFISPRSDGVAPPVAGKRKTSYRGRGFIFTLTGLLAIAAFVFALDQFRHGGWDAMVLWNLKARFIASSTVSSISTILDSAFLGLHPDYPLLLPSLVARGWQYGGIGAIAPPVVIAALFTIAVVTITIGGVRALSTKSQAWVSGSILVGTPFLLGHGASQYADIAVACFVTAAVVLYCLYDSDPRQTALPFLAGAMAAAAACTKNEGILFLVVLVFARLFAARSRQEWLRFGAGASVGVLTLLLFKLWYAPPSEFFASRPVRELLLGVTSLDRNLQVLRGLRDAAGFGQWWLNPLPLMAVQAAVMWKGIAIPTLHGRNLPSWFTAACSVLGMLCGVCLLYLMSPYDVEYHIQSSADRLLLQLWPSVVLLYSMLVADRDASDRSPSVSAQIVRVGVVALLCGGLWGWSAIENVRNVAVSSPPQIEVNPPEVGEGETYTMRITGISTPRVLVSYSLDGNSPQWFDVFLGTDGSAEFPIAPTTRKGSYRFIAVRSPESGAWINFANEATILVK